MSYFEDEKQPPPPDEASICRCLSFLARTDKEEADARALVKALEENKKTIKALAYLQADGTNADRENQAHASSEFKKYLEDYENAVADHALISNKRKRAELIIEVWRSINSNRRAGMVT